MSISRTAAIAILMLGAAACGRSENANNEVSAETTADVNATQADASNLQSAEGANAAEPTASKGMPVPGTKTPEHVAHDMNDMGNMDMNQMNHM